MVNHNKKETSFNFNLLGKIVEKLNISVTISDPKVDDNPLIYVNKGFTKTTGYTPEESLGRNCRFLQGEHTNQNTVKKIKKDIGNQKSFTTEILNYRKDGIPFWNELNVFPIFNEAHSEVDYYVGVQKDVTQRKEAQILLDDNMNLAKKIQTGFLPDKISQLRITIDGKYIPCDKLGGDLYYWSQINEHQYAVFILDVMGHGVASSLVGTAIRATLLDIMLNETDQGKVMQTINEKMHQLFGGMDEIMYFTGISLLIDFNKNTVRYVNAGHPPAIYLDAAQSTKTLDSKYPPIGMIPDIDYTEDELDIAPNSRILLYTDGFLNNEDIKTNVKQLSKETLSLYNEDDVEFLNRIVKHRLKMIDTSDDITVVSIHCNNEVN